MTTDRDLLIEDLTVRYGDLAALRDVALRLPAGQTLAVVGASGSGKSTLLRGVAGLEPLAAGSVHLGGRRVDGVPVHRRGMALMFQDGQLFAHLSVAGNVGYPLRLRRRPRAECARRVDELLALVGLEGYGDRLPGTLSGGQRQRVALARALASEPELLLLDEPLSALDRGLRARLADDLRAILRAAGTTALVVTHDNDEAFALADRIAVLHEGRLVQEGPVSDVLAAPADAGVAGLLGFAAVLRGSAARRLAAGAGLALADDEALAVRPGGLVAAVDRPDVGAGGENGGENGGETGGGLAGSVRQVVPATAGARLMVGLDGEAGLVVPAVPADPAAPPAEGDAVRVEARRWGLAVVPA